jgi:hypothetical protein
VSGSGSTVRNVVARVLVVIGALALVSGAVFAWASPTLFDSDKFAARARQALDDSPALRRVVARTLVIHVVEAQKADLIAFRPLLITTAETLVGTDAFGDVFELAARHAHELFTDEPGSNVVLRANEAALLLIDTVRTVAPDVADRIPTNIEPTLLRLRDSAGELRVYRGAERVRTLGVVLPIAGVLAWGGSVVLAADRRRMLRTLGVVLTGLGVLLLIGIRIGGHVVAGHFDLPTERQAAQDVWATFLDGLQAIAWFGVVGGLILAASVQALATRRGSGRRWPTSSRASRRRRARRCSWVLCSWSSARRCSCRRPRSWRLR